jgi:hypothetical protein
VAGFLPPVNDDLPPHQALSIDNRFRLLSHITSPFMEAFLPNAPSLGIWALPAPNVLRNSSTDRLHQLRTLMAQYDLDGYLIVHSNAHYIFSNQNFVDRRIAFITNSDVQLFGGSKH